MKKKSPRGIPDFSRQATRPKDASKPDAAATDKRSARTAPPPPRAKPQSSSAKSGGRGK
ncbi:MAG TPA: hypothetical protein VEZ47_13445 [Gemmatirosa sp.]|nr:hypothetical protein [Gemmatirosa sp.]